MDERVLNVALQALHILWCGSRQVLGEEMDCTWPWELVFSEGSAEMIQCIFRKAPAVLIPSENYCELHFFAMYQ